MRFACTAKSAWIGTGIGNIRGSSSLKPVDCSLSKTSFAEGLRQHGVLGIRSEDRQTGAGMRRWTRRVWTFLTSTLLLSGMFGKQRGGSEMYSMGKAECITIPLQSCRKGGSCCVLTVSSPDGGRRQLSAIVDTGSPYLTIPHNVINQGMTAKFPTSFSPTTETYGSVTGNMTWLNGILELLPLPSSNIDFGVADMNISKVSGGGALLGIIKYSNPASTKIMMRPTVLDQISISSSPIASFKMDTPAGELVLSTKPLISAAADALKLVDLRPLGDTVDHYACRVTKLRLDGFDVLSGDMVTKQVVAVLDTGLSGCLMSRPLWDELKAADFSPARVSSLSATLATEQDADVVISSARTDAALGRLFYVAPVSLDWFDVSFEEAPHVVVLGQTFLAAGVLTVDIDLRRALFSSVQSIDMYAAGERSRMRPVSQIAAPLQRV